MKLVNTNTVFVLVFFIAFANFASLVLERADYLFLTEKKGIYRGEEEEEEERDNPAAAIQQEIELTKDPALGYVPKERLLAAMEETERLLKVNKTRAAISNILWEERGPNNVGGRTRVVHFDKNDASNKTVWVASVGGGLWKTTDITATTPVWDKIDDFFANIAITSFAQNPTNPNIMYFGTGEGFNNSDAIQGNGIWKSTNGGTTWAQLASTTGSVFQFSQRMVVDASGNVYTCTKSGGLQKSTNGGTTWTKIWGSGVAGGTTNNVTDMEIAANGDFYIGANVGTASTIFKSTNSGTTWAALTLPTGNKFRTELACAPSNANVVYCIFYDGAGGKFMKTTDAGTTWSAITQPQFCDQGTLDEFTRGQGWYDLAIGVDPNDENTLCIGGVDALKSTDGGSTWKQISSWVGSTVCAGVATNAYIHADQHAIVYSPGSSSIAVWGTDGGISHTTNLNATTPSFTTKNTGYNVTQFYGCAMHPTINTDYFLAGAQDNGTQQYNSIGMNSTNEVTGGDGAFCHIDQNNPNLQVTSYVYQNYYISTNGGTSFGTSASGTGGSFINPTDYDDVNDFLYTCRGNNQYSRVTIPGAVVTDVPVATFSGTPTNIYVSPNTNHRIYVGTSSGRVVKVDDANTATPIATHINSGAGMPTGSVSCIAVEVGNENHILVTYSNYGVNSVWETTNAGTAWTSIEGNLPDMPIRWIIFSPLSNDAALVATETGVWTTDNLNAGATVWGPSVDGMANVSTRMLQYRSADNVIAAATHGRGLYTTSSFTPFNNLTFTKASTSLNEASITTPSAAPDDCLAYYDITIPVKLTRRPTGSNATVTISVNAGSTATLNSDYQLLTPSLTFATNGAISQNAIVRVFNDDMQESAETIILDLSESHADITAISTIAQHIITIKDNDYPPSLASITTNAIGTGTVRFTNGPFGGYYEDGKTQMIFLASELSAAGISANSTLASMALNVIAKQSSMPYSGFTLKLTHVPTATTNFATNNFITPATAFTTVYSQDLTTTTGWNTLTFDTNFIWDGTNNLLVEACFDNNNYTLDDSLASTTLAANRTITRRVDGSVGCNLTGGAGLSVRSTTRPNVQWGVRTFTPVATTMGTSDAYVGPNQTVYFYDNTGKIMAKIENTSNHNFGCTTVEIDRAGTGTAQFWDNNPATYIMMKTFKITPENNNPAATYNATFYYTLAEVNGWLAATGSSLSNMKVVKIANHFISDVSPANPFVSDVTLGLATTGSYNASDYTISATFSGFSGFGPGSPAPLPLSLLDFSGSIESNHIYLTWHTTDEKNVANYQLERYTNNSGTPQTIALVPAKNQNEAIYKWTDANLASGHYVYRLRSTDLNGTFFYSNSLAFDLAPEWQVQIAPNPFTDEVAIYTNQFYSAPVNIKWINIEGKTVGETISTDYSSGTIYLKNLNLTKGVYIISVQSEFGVYRTRMIKE